MYLQISHTTLLCSPVGLLMCIARYSISTIQGGDPTSWMVGTGNTTQVPWGSLIMKNSSHYNDTISFGQTQEVDLIQLLVFLLQTTHGMAQHISTVCFLSNNLRFNLKSPNLYIWYHIYVSPGIPFFYLFVPSFFTSNQLWKFKKLQKKSHKITGASKRPSLLFVARYC